MGKWYRHARSYISKDPEKRQRQLDNLKCGRHKKPIKAKSPGDDPFSDVYKDDICSYLEKQFYIVETKRPVILEDWQKERILKPLFSVDDSTGLRKHTLGLLGLPKKNSKSTMAAMIANYFLFQDEDFGELLLTANSKEQSSWIIFDKLKKSLLMNREQFKWVKIFDDVIENKRTNTVARVVAPNYKTSSGMNPNLVIFDELWAYEDTDSRNARKFFDEMTTVPTRKQPLTIIVSYAGHDEETLIYEIYKRGLEGKDKKMFFFWSHENLASWITKDYLDTQRKRLRANTYLRLHENCWTSSEERFIDMEMWDECIDLNHHPPLPDKQAQLFIGVDIGISHDTSAVVAVYKEGNRLFLAKHRKWQPSRKNKIDLEATVESYIKELAEDFTIKEVRFDPYQFHRSAVTLRKEGINMVEFPQTLDRLTLMSQNLFDLIKERNIVFYKDKELRQHAQKAVAKETSRGWRIVKKQSSHKIDLIISLAMAALGCVQVKILRAGVLW